MSGKPYPEGVTEFKALLAQMSKTSARSHDLTVAIDAAKLELETSDESFYAAKKALFELMKKMDVESSGNYGWENRMTWFLVELQNQYTLAASPSAKEES